MAKVDEDLDLDVGAGEKKSGGKLKSIIIFSVIGVVLIAGSVTLTLMLIGGDKGEPPADSQTKQAAAESGDHGSAATDGGKVAYLDFNPAFVVNLHNKDSDIRYLQINMSVMVGQESDLDVVKTHMPVLRHHLNMLFSSLDFNDIRDREGKNKLTAETLKVVTDALKEAGAEAVVKAVFFNSIVGQ